MRELHVIEFLSLDGVMQSPASPDEDTEGGFRHGGWQRPYFDEVLGGRAAEGMSGTDTYLFGRKTYEKMAAYWPTAPSDDPYARHLNSTPKYVASTSLREAAWEPTTVLQGDVAEEVARLKAEPGGNIAVLGSGELLQTLIRHDLVDQYFLGVFPLLLGGGKRLFRELEDPRRLTLVDSTPTTTGGLLLTYRPTR
jgi:dihydrofolate reductase